MKKRMLAVVLAVCALAVLAIGSTFAFFTSNDNAGNTFTMGNVKIELTETSTESEGVKTGEVAEDGKGIKYSGAMPGDVFSKEPTVTNTGDNTAWIRVKIDVTTEDEAMVENMNALKASIIDDMTANYGWAVTNDDEYIYYTLPVISGEAVDLFKTVTIPTSWGNEAANASFSIEISAQAVQYDNNGASWDQASWTDFDTEA